MAKELSSAVKQALNDIYYNISAQRGAQGLALLEKASAAGDGDASCILARCLCGKQYVWAGHGFPEDDDRATMLLHKSVEQGSALGVLICIRTEELTPELLQKMPYSSLQEAFDTVLAIAEGRRILSVCHRQHLFLVGFYFNSGKRSQLLPNPGRLSPVSDRKHLKM